MGHAYLTKGVSTPSGGAIIRSVLAVTSSTGTASASPFASSATGRSTRLIMTYGAHTNTPCNFSPPSLRTCLPILNLHPSPPPIAFSTLSAPHTHGKQGKQRNLSHVIFLDVAIRAIALGDSSVVHETNAMDVD